MQQTSLKYWFCAAMLACFILAYANSANGQVTTHLKPNSATGQDDIPQNDAFAFGFNVDNPELPRYLCIGDSISSNYGKAIKDLHAGKINAHHPPVNCGSAVDAVAKIDSWLGDFEKPGKQWDIISFNFGHWDVSHSKRDYQASLRLIIGKLKATNAKLVWVTTCPVPLGINGGKAAVDPMMPGRTPSAMRDSYNPWAAEVVAQFPEITVCDQWQFVYEGRMSVYQAWWKSDDIHFAGAPAYGLGRLVAQHVMDRLGLYRPRGFEPPPDQVKPAGSAPPLQPAWQPAVYEGPRFGDYYSDRDAVQALPERWKTAVRLPDGFPHDLQLKLSPQANDHQGWVYPFGSIANHLQLKSIKRSMQAGFGLNWIQGREDVRFRFGPGLTGDELFQVLTTAHDAPPLNPNELLDGVLHDNIATYHDLYRITRDRYYSNQIEQYATAILTASKRNPQWLTTANDSSLTNQINWTYLNASRLLLEQVRIDRGSILDPRIRLAKQFLEASIPSLKRKFLGDFRRPLDTDSAQNAPFKPGRNTRWLVNERRVPELAAQRIESGNWRNNFRDLATLTAAVRSLEELQKLDNKTDYTETIGVFRRIITASLSLFETENDCILLENRPYFFHSVNAMNDGQAVIKLGHPVFPGPQIEDAESILEDLVYVWEAGQTFGCSTTLIVGYSNSLTDHFLNPTGGKAGYIYPRNRVASPWYLAASGSVGQSAPGHIERAIFATVFSPKLLESRYHWTSQRNSAEEIRLLKSATLFKLWQRRELRKK
ncbi:MAG: hypothetical protein ACI814_004938 [Mariniblastus sp.]|jgi:hypothetical protein